VSGKFTLKEIKNGMTSPRDSIHIVWNSWPSHRNVTRTDKVWNGPMINPVFVSLEEIS
jgi:hypothetical protein